MEWLEIGLIWMWGVGILLSEIALFNASENSIEKKLNAITAIIWPISVPLFIVIGAIRKWLR